MRIPSAGPAFERAARAPRVVMPRSTFDMSQECRTTFSPGWLVPFACKEVLPGDTWNVSLHGFARIITLLFPLMDNLVFRTYFFFVPNRLVWDNWERFCGYQKNPSDSIAYTVPQTSTILASRGQLWDYLGVKGDPNTNKWNVLAGRGYQRIWDEWFRDEDIQASQLVSTGDGPDNPVAYTLLRVNKRPDYFSKARPWPLKGGVSLLIPSSGIVPVASDTNPPSFKNVSGVAAGSLKYNTTGAPVAVFGQNDVIGGSFTAGEKLYWNVPHLQVDLTNANTATINSLRQAEALQVFLERQARGGSRYIEFLWSQYGTESSDARLQRTEYLGGGVTPLVVSPIAQQSETGTTPQGTLTGVGVINAHGRHGFARSFEEHGYWFGLMCVGMASNSYQYGMERHWFRRTLYDYAIPALAHMGEQAILGREIYVSGDAGDTTVWGYAPRFDEYRQGFNLVTGQMQSGDPASYDPWHLAQDWPSRPQLNDAFVREEPPMDRVLAVAPTVSDGITFDSVLSAKAARVLPVSGIPGWAGRF